MASKRVSQWLTVATVAAALSTGVMVQARQASSSAGAVAADGLQGAAGRGAGPAPVADVSHGPVIAIGDVIKVTTANEDTFTTKAVVDGDGTFDFGVLGRIKAAGLTARQLETEVRKKLDPDWVKNPQVTVELVPTLSKRVLVGGRVRDPRAYPFSGRLTVLEALLGVGGTADDAGERAYIIRANPDGSVLSAEQMSDAAKIYVDLYKLDNGDLSENYTLNDGDFLFVEKALPLIITGEIKNAGPYPARRGLTVQQAVALAGGLTEKGKSSGIKIQRPTADPKKPLLIEVKDWKIEQVKPGDTIIVPAKIM
jgi:polysaccharide export outer membrane protein